VSGALKGGLGPVKASCDDRSPKERRKECDVEMISKKVLASIVIIGLLAFAMGWGTYSYFSDTETSRDNYFVAGTMDLELSVGEDYKNPWSGAIVALEDMKPCEWEYKEVWLHNVGDNPGSLWMHIFNVRGDDYINTDAEREAGGIGVYDIYNWITFDLKILEPAEKTIIHPDDHIKLGDIRCIWIPLGDMAPSQVIRIQLSFHLQEETDNRYQGDRCLFDMEFLLNQVGAPPPKSNRILLENKNPPQTWEPMLGDGKWGIAEYHTSDLTLTVEAHGLDPNTDYQIKLTSPEEAAWYPVDEWHRKAMASALASNVYDGTNPGTAPPSDFNLYERGYYDIGEGGNLFAGPPYPFEGDDVGVWAFTKHGVTPNGVTTDKNGYFKATKTAALPAGDYSYIKLVIGLDDSPWTPVLMECWIPLFFTIP